MERYPPRVDPAPARIGGRYRISGEIGHGGMGVVHAAFDERSGERVALKVLAREGSTPSLERRFRLEYQTLASLAHPRIVRALDYGVDASVGAWYTMDLLDGQDLDSITRPPFREVCRMLRDVASALAFLHARRLIHRDIKLRNIRLTATGDAKLLDFGLLATSGVAPDEVVGTPSYLAPECLRMAVLDHRVDLFALGAVAYRLLTGRAPFPTSRFDELEEWWRTTPPAPSELADDIPPALDALVLSLLCIDPLGRPGSAAEVIDRLTSIGGLERPPELEVARGYLASAAIVGRDRELSRLVGRLKSALASGTQSVTIEGASGDGKSRLLRELALQAQLAGSTVITIDCDSAGRLPFGVLRRIADALYATDRKRTTAAASPRIGVIGRALPDLAARMTLTLPRRDPPRGDPAEERLLLQAQLSTFLSEAISERKISILLDDAQRCDEGSAVALAGVSARAKDEHLFLACAIRTDEPTRAVDAFETIREGAERVILSGLSEEETLELVNAAFGDVSNAPRFARLLHASSGGSPIQLTELLRDLVESNVVRYDGGLWHVPDAVELALPKGLASAMDVRVATLARDDRELAASLAVYGERAPIDVCAAIAGIGEDDALARLQVLTSAGFLTFVDDHYRVRHDGFREALLRALSPEEKKRIHLRVARALEASGQSAPASIGWHFIEGGEPLLGAPLLETAGRQAFEVQSFADAIAMLEVVVRVYEEHHLHPRRCLELRSCLLTCGMQCSKATVERHAPHVADALEEAAGVGTMRTLSRFMPFLLAFLLGLGGAWVRWIFGGLRRKPSPVAAFAGFLTAVVHHGSVSAISGRIDAALEAARRLAIFERAKNRVPCAAYLMAQSFYQCQTGEWTSARRDLARALEIFEHDQLTPIHPEDRRMAIGGAKFAIASLYAQDQQPSAETWLSESESMGLRFFAAAAKAARVQYHRLRGEEQIASTIEREMELELLQGGSLWILEAQVQWTSALLYAYTHDVVGMRRSIERLETLCANGFLYQPVLDLVRAEHLRETGQTEPARELLRQCLDGLPEADLLLREHALLAIADGALSDGDLEQAERFAEKCIALASRPECGRATARLLATRTKALVLAERGDFDGAIHLLDDVASEVDTLASPLIHVEMLAAHARIARYRGELTAFETFVGSAKTWAERAGSATLAARVELLAPTSSGTLHYVARPESDTIAASTQPRDAATKTQAREEEESER